MFKFEENLVKIDVEAFDKKVKYVAVVGFYKNENGNVTNNRIFYEWNKIETFGKTLILEVGFKDKTRKNFIVNTTNETLTEISFEELKLKSFDELDELSELYKLLILDDFKANLLNISSKALLQLIKYCNPCEDDNINRLMRILVRGCGLTSNIVGKIHNIENVEHYLEYAHFLRQPEEE